MNSRCTPFDYAHRSMAFDEDSVPLSTMIDCGALRMNTCGNALMMSKRAANSKVVRIAFPPDTQQENVA
jgi:hypothetical protein